MAIEAHQFTVTIPAGTTKAAPYVYKFPLALFDIESIDLDVPAGPSGLMGFYLAVGGQQWIPWQMGEYFIWDNKDRNYPLSSQPTSTSWALVGYNTGQYDHKVTVGFNVNLLGPVPSAPAPQLAIIQSPPLGNMVLL